MLIVEVATKLVSLLVLVASKRDTDLCVIIHITTLTCPFVTDTLWSQLLLEVL